MELRLSHAEHLLSSHTECHVDQLSESPRVVGGLWPDQSTPSPASYTFRGRLNPTVGSPRGDSSRGTAKQQTQMPSIRSGQSQMWALLSGRDASLMTAQLGIINWLILIGFYWAEFLRAVLLRWESICGASSHLQVHVWSDTKIIIRMNVFN